MKWHGAWLYGVHRTCAEMAAVSCGTSHASAVSTPLRWILKKRAVTLVTHVEPHASAMSLLKRAENRAIYAIINQSNQQWDCTHFTTGTSQPHKKQWDCHCHVWNPATSHTKSSETVTAMFGTLQLYLKSPRQDSARDMGGNLCSVQQSGGPCHHSGLFLIRPRHCDWSAASKRFCRKLSLSSICCISWKQQQEGQAGSPSLRGWVGGGGGGGGGGGVMLWGRGGGSERTGGSNQAGRSKCDSKPPREIEESITHIPSRQMQKNTLT